MHRGSTLVLASLALCLALAACGGRAARPVAVTQSFDKDMTCAQIALEVDANKKRINSLHKEDNDRHGRNAAVATMGVLLGGLPALMLIDDGEAQEKEINAYNARNNSLTQEAAKDGCTEEEMAAAVSANSTYTAAAAATAATGSPAAGTAAVPSTNQVAVKPQTKPDASAAQAKFDAWYAGNAGELQQKLTQEVRDEALLRSCAAHTRPNRPVDIVDTDVVAEQADGLLVNISYIKVGDNSTCDESRADSFLLSIEDDRLLEVSYVGDPATAPVAATAGSTATSDLAVSAAQFDAWYAANSDDFARQMNVYAHETGLVSANCSADPVKVTDTTVTGRQGDRLAANITIWKQSSSTNCEVLRTDAYLLRIENDELVEIAYAGPAGSLPAGSSTASATTAPDAELAAAQARYDAWYAVNATDLRRKLNVAAMKEDFYGADCGSAEANITESRVAEVKDDGYVVDLKWWNPSKWNICERHRHDRFHLRIVNEELVEIVYIGAAAESSAAAN